MATLARINVHPVKSLDPQTLDEAVVLSSGALALDRRFALVDRQGEFVNGKRFPAVHRLRSAFDEANNVLTLRIEDAGESERFEIEGQRAELTRFLSDYFATPLELAENRAGGFPDDTDSPGPTVISTATLAEVAGWFEGLTVDGVRRRFRANLEIDGVEAFWEDRLVDEGTGVVRFRIGEAELWGTNPCQRCPVPSRDPYTGEVIHGFAKTFSRRREETLPAWAPAARFDHFYRLAVNTRAATEKQCTIRVGDAVRVLGPGGWL